MICAGVTIFAIGGTDDDAITAAKSFVSTNGLTSADVKIVKADEIIRVITKKGIMLCEKTAP